MDRTQHRIPIPLLIGKNINKDSFYALIKSPQQMYRLKSRILLMCLKFIEMFVVVTIGQIINLLSHTLLFKEKLASLMMTCFWRVGKERQNNSVFS